MDDQPSNVPRPPLAAPPRAGRDTTDFDGFGIYEAQGPLQPGELTLLGRGAFRARVERVWTPDLAIMRRRSSLRHLLRGGTARRVIFALPDAPGGPPVSVNGVTRRGDDLSWVPPDLDILMNDPGQSSWSVNFSPPDFDAACAAVLGTPSPLRGRVPALLPTPPALAIRLRAAVWTACAETEGVSPAIREDILLGILAALPQGPPVSTPSAARRRAIAADLANLAEESDPVPLTSVCARLGVPLRTLNIAANAVLGTSAAAFLRRRRLHLAHRVLSSGAAATVTEAATVNGFWELGRFAVDYRAIFGESPSVTLRRTRPVGGAVRRR